MKMRSGGVRSTIPYAWIPTNPLMRNPLGFRHSEDLDAQKLAAVATSRWPQAASARDAEPTLTAPNLMRQPPGHHEC